MAQRNRKQSDTNTISRRTILRTSGTLAALAVAGTAPTGAQSGEQLPLEISIYAEEEYITITNTGDETVDLTGYSVNFEAPLDDYDQSRALAGEVVIESGDSITVPTGAREVTAGRIVELEEPYDGEVLNNEDPDVVGIFDPQGNLVASSDGSSGGGGDDGGGDDGDQPGDGGGDDGDQTSDSEDPGPDGDGSDDGDQTSDGGGDDGDQTSDSEDPGPDGDGSDDGDQTDGDGDRDAADDGSDEPGDESGAGAETDDEQPSSESDDDGCPNR